MTRTLQRLTEQQQAIVSHGEGPALVFAVAGAGKTTAMVHRIERLLRERVAAPRRILATSFGRATVNDIRLALGAWPHCAGVKVSTLHAIGNQVLRRAQARGYLSDLELDTAARAELDKQLLFQTLSVARRQRVEYIDELETLDQEDFLSFLGACKSNLRYADWREVGPRLPEHARTLAGQAVAPPKLPWYLDLYRLYEQVRQERGLVTFDDMLLSGWELLVCHADLQAELQGLYDYVLVDEFQDVNKAQHELLDLLTQRRRNYMVIGDDDQTIYEWRGASVEYMLGFPTRYQAQTYLINDNFRCKASHLALANKVIEHNRARQPKHLSLTQGFDGVTSIAFADGQEQLGRQVVVDIQAELAAGRRPEEIAVLVRIYAQTPAIEQFLIGAGIPYQIVGSVPFYRRQEILALLHYCQLARFERAAGQPASSAARAGGDDGPHPADDEAALFARAWQATYNRPKRYISQELAERVRALVVERGYAPSQALRQLSASATNRGIASKMERLADDLAWLAARLERGSAESVLRELDSRLGYSDYLRQSGGFPETGEGRAANVAAMLDYARGKGSVHQFLEHLAALAAEHAAEQREQRGEGVVITTIFRAKGLEWPVVLVPNCNQGTIPFGERERLAEERRLFYVALTRPRQTLRLYCLKNVPISQFLAEADYQHTLGGIGAVQAALERDPEGWSAQEALAVARSGRQFQLERYFQHWWQAQEGNKARVAQSVQRFYGLLEQRQLAGLLRLSGEQLQLWRSLAPLRPDDPEQHFEGIDDLLPRAGARAAAQTASARPGARKGAAAAQPQPDQPRFSGGDTVQHSAFGVGTVLSVEQIGQEEELTVRFSKVGLKRLSAIHANLKLLKSALPHLVEGESELFHHRDAETQSF